MNNGPEMNATSRAGSREWSFQELSWEDVKKMAAELDTMFLNDAGPDQRKLQQTLFLQQDLMTQLSSAEQAECHALQEKLDRWKSVEQQKTSLVNQSQEIHVRTQELAKIKCEIMAESEKLQLDEQATNEAIQALLDRYERVREELMTFQQQHQQNIALAKHWMSLYASMTGVKWDFDTDPSQCVAGYVCNAVDQRVIPFEVETNDSTPQQLADALWDHIDQAFQP